MKNKLVVSLLAVGMALSLVGAGAWAKSAYDDYLKQKESNIDMRFGQMESSANAEFMAETENYRHEDMKRVDKEVNAYLEQKLSEAGHAYYASLDADKAKAQIKAEHDQLIQKLKDYIDQQASGYMAGGK